MKTRIATLVLVFGLFLASNTYANEPIPASKAVSHSVSTYIGDNIEYPAFAENEKWECCVVVKLTIQEDGTFVVNAANSVDDRMRKHVVSAISKLDDKADYYAQYAGQQVVLKVKFDLKLV
ncbi:MAG: hypothetical protein C0591_00440 [Marinilabiliales bacterium]|jgi:hypothetical protein|nr:MAG: hypothetical protein C0591_00440 [Marinilabiliales bacterium]